MTQKPQFAPGTLIGGKYRLDGLIDTGGMGAVYEATQMDLERRVALKVLHRELSDEPEVIERFHREAKLAASIGHDNICEVTDFGTSEEGVPYLVMPLLKGRSFQQVLTEDTLDIGRLCDIMLQVLSALEAAHAAGVIHRDLKPANIFISQVGDREDFVKLLDFGVSKMLASDTAKALTRTGALIGTPVYMAPEQARGDRSQDHRLDLYAAGVIMYESLTGKLPHEGETYTEIAIKIVTEPYVHPRAIKPEIPEALEAVVVKAMAKDPAERYEGARQMREAIDAAMAAKSAPSQTEISGSSAPIIRPETPPLRRHHFLLIPALLLIVAAAIVVFALYALWEPPSGPARLGASPPALGPSPAPTELSSGEARDSSKSEDNPVSRAKTLSVTVNADKAHRASSTVNVAKKDSAPPSSKGTAAEQQTQPSEDPSLPPPAPEATSTPEPTETYTTMSQLKEALKKGKITRAEYNARQSAMRKKRAQEYDRAKREYRAGVITKDEFNRRVAEVKHKYESGGSDAASPSAPTPAAPQTAANAPPEPTVTYANMGQLKQALKKGQITRAEYAAEQEKMRRKRAAEYDRLKRALQSGAMTRAEYNRRVIEVKRKYEGK
jgi:serine/threonine protein kinase